MPRRGENIYKRKDGRWEARYVKEILPDGRKKYGSVYADTYKLVKSKRELVQRNIALHAKPHADITVNEVLEQWFLNIRNQVKPATYQKYEGMVRNHIAPAIGDMPVRYITSGVIDRFSNDRLHNGKNSGGGLSRKTVNDILMVLALVFSFSETEYRIPGPKIRRLREEYREIRVLSPEEQECLERYLSADMDVYKFSVFLALYSGIRIGELCALRWEDIDGGVLTVNKTMQRLKGKDGGTEILVSSPKSVSSNRRIPLPNFVLVKMGSFRRESGYVVANSEGKYTEPRLMQIKFQKMVAEAGLPKTNFHALRHTFATRCVETGFDMKSLSEILGHSDVKTTLNRYVHSSFALKQQNMGRLQSVVCI